MRKILCSAILVGGFLFTNAQTIIPFKKNQTTSVQKKEALKTFQRNLEINRAQLFSGNLSENGTAVSFNTSAKNVTPSASIDTELWGEVKAVGQDEKLLFQINYNYGTNAKVDMKLLDSNINVVKSFTVELPESANSFSVLKDYFYDQDGKRNFLIYVHYFEGGMGPEYQKNSIFIVKENGELRTKLDGYGAKVIDDGENGKVMAFQDTEDEMIVTNYKMSDFSVEKSMTVSLDLLNFMLGSTVNFMNVKGEPSLVIAHYEKLFLDNDTFEVFPDNHLIINILDLNFNLKKSISLDISTAYPDSPYTIPMAEFGLFYSSDKYDITDKTFNNDDQLETLYAISYFDLFTEDEWKHYFVGDENGNRIRSLQEQILGSQPLQELPGNDDQIGFFIGEEEGISALKMFDIKSWVTAYEFPAFHNGELLSLNFNRIPAGDSYEYLFGMPDLDKTGNEFFGNVNQYDAQGQLKKTNKFYLGENAMSFTPLLYTAALTPNLYLNNNQPLYSYASNHLLNGTGYNIFRVAKNDTDIIFETKGDETKGNVFGNQFITDNNNVIKKIALLYSKGDDNMTVDFYDLPFTTLKTQENLVKNNLLVYSDHAVKSVRWNQSATSFTVHNMAGSIVRQGGKAESFSSSGLPSGVYILTITTTKGKKLTKRFIL